MTDDTERRDPRGPATPGEPGWIRNGRLLLITAAAAVLAAVLATGVVLMVNGSKSKPAVAAPLPSDTFTVAPGALPPLSAQDQIVPPARTIVRGQTCRLPGGPSRIAVPSLCIDGPLVPTSLQPDGALAIPFDVHQVGLWDGGAGLGASGSKTAVGGTTLLAGHVDHVGQGEGTLYRLSGVKPGAVIYTSDARGLLQRWRTVSLRVVVKAKLPPDLFVGASGPRRLVVVTCGGPIEHIAGYGNTYRDNVIVTAIPG